MERPFQIILIEDNESDAELLEIQFKKLELEFNLNRIDSGNQLFEILKKNQVDLIISDYNLPGLNGFELLIRVRENYQDLPFILVSGFIGEEKAVDAMLEGASDYVLKDNLDRLVPAVQRELLHYREHLKTESERDEAIQQLKERVKEQKCLYAISSLNNQELSIDELLKKAVRRIPTGWQYPETTGARIEFDQKIYQTKNYKESKWDLTSTDKKIKKGPLRLNVAYLEEKPVADIGPFIKEEHYLINSIVDILSMKISQILDQQELEKKQKLLEEERDRLLEAQRVAEVGDWYYNVETGKIMWSSMLFKIFEREPESGEPDYEELKSYFQSQFGYHNELVEIAIKEGIPYSTDFTIQTEKGTEKHIHVEGKPEIDREGRVKKLFGTTMDITNRKKAEEALQASEQRFKSLVHEGMDLIAILDEEGKYKYVAPTKHRVEEMGRAVDEFYGKSIYDILHPDYHDLLKNSIRSIGPYESVTVEPFQYLGSKGEWRWMESTITNLTENSSINGYVANSRDVTERIERERKLRDILEYSTNLFYRGDPDHNITYVSPQSQKFFGCTPEEAKKHWFDFVTDHPSNEKALKKAYKAVQTGESQDPYELQLQKVTGEIIWVVANEAPIVENGKTVAMVGSLTDITERKKAIEQLIDTEQKMRDIVEHSTNMFYRHDTDHVLTYVSPQSAEFLGCSPEEAKRRWTEFVTNHPDNERALKFTKKAIETGKSQPPYELQLQRADGENIWVRVNEAPVVENGKTIAMVGSLTDITARKEYEEKLEQLSLVAAKTTDVIIITNAEERITWVNKAFEDLTGYTLEESLGRIPGDFLQGPETDPEAIKRVAMAIDNRETLHETVLNYAKDGKKYWLDMKIDPIFEDDECTGFIAIERDVTEKRKAYDKLASTEQKLREIVEHSTNLFFKHDTNHQLEYVSPQSYDLVGFTPEETMKQWTELVTDHPANEIGFKRTMKAIETGEPQEPYELQFKHADGGVIWARVNEAPIVENGKTVAIVGSLTDITEQKKYEEKLEELSLVASKTTDVIIMTDSEDKITWVNKAFEELMGYTLEECVGRIPGKLLRGSATDLVTSNRIQQAKLNRESIQEVILNYTKDGRQLWLDMTADPIFNDDGKFEGYIAIDKDVTEKIRQSRKLQESVERFEVVTKATSDTIWDADLIEDTVKYNYNIKNVFGYDFQDEETPGAWWVDKIHPDDRQRVTREFELAELEKKERLQVEYRFKAADGSYKYVNDRAFIIDDENGRPVRMIGAMQDITKQKEENLWLKLLESAITNTTESIAILEENKTNTKGRRILYVNDAFEKMTGFAKNDILGDSLLKFIGPNTNRETVAKTLRDLEKGKTSQMEVAYNNREGKECWAQISFAPVRDSNRDFSHWICIGRDTTDRRKRESELRESLLEKETLLMEIHHRVKNNLAVVSSMMQLQAMQEEDENLQRKLYDSVVRIRTMVTIHELLYESRSFAKINFTQNLKKLVSMIIETIQNEQKIFVEYNCDDLELNVNQAIPVSLIVNEVVTNAIKHAFSGRKEGKIRLTVEKKDNDYVRVQIMDNGKGLPQDFDKMKTSLGMQLIQVLVEQLEAKYHYIKNPEGGTIFEIQFEKNIVKGIGNAYLT